MLPTTYTSATLAAFMRDTLKAVADALGWTGESSYTEAINSVLLACGATDLTQVTDIVKVRALAKREAWRAAMEATAGDYDTTNLTDTLKRSQAHTQAAAMFKLAADEYQTLVDDRASANALPSGIPRSTNARVRRVW